MDHRQDVIMSRDVSTIKQQIIKNGAGNADYFPIYDQAMALTGLRGTKGLMFYGFVIILFIVALANLSVTITLLSVLRIGYGMESLEFIRPGLLLRFLHHADLGIVNPSSGVIAGFADEDITLTGDSQPVIFKAAAKTSPYRTFDSVGPSLEIGPDGTIIKNVDEFRVRSPSTGRTVFSTNYEDFSLPTGVPKLSVKEAHVSRIVSATDEPLHVKSAFQVLLKGNEGLSIEGKEVMFAAGVDLSFKSVNQSIILDGKKGIQLSVDKLPLAAETRGGASRWYKICVCMPSGRLFRIPVREHGFGCNDVRFPESINPCY